MAEPPVRARGRRNRRWLIPVIVLLVVIGGGGGAWFATRPAAAAYRTAKAAPAQVTAVLAATGTIQPVSEATVAFPVAGEVQTVAVHAGQQVTAGQTLAQLNTTSMAGQISSEQAGVATAQAKLAADSSSQTAAITTAATQSSRSGGTPTTTANSAKLAGLTQGLTTGQKSVRTSQQQVDSDLALVSAAVKQEDDSCPPVIQQLIGAAHGTTGTPSTTTTPPTGPTGPPTEAQVTDCTGLMQQVLDDQSKAATAENGLATAEAQLTTAVDQAVSAVQQAARSTSTGTSGSGRTTGSSSGSSSSSSGSGGSGSRGSDPSGSSGQPASAAQLAADQAAADAAGAELAVAQQNAAAATLLSPLTGTVAEVDLAPGDSVSAGSTTAHVVVVGPGATEVTTAVTDTQVGQVKPGQSVAVTPDGGSARITGRVTAIGQLGTTTSGGSASYPVTVTLDPSSRQLFAGSNAAVTITLNSAHAAVAVPTSAVHSVGGFSFLTVVKDGRASEQRVTLGVSGPLLTQVTSGVTAGAQVALANLNEALPTSGTTTGRAGRIAVGGGGGGGFGGGGGGFAGGRGGG